MMKEKKHNRERGQSLTEFAVSLVFLLTLLAGVVDLGRMFFVYVTVREAAQEGAAFASICPDEEAVIARVKASSDFPLNLNDPDIIVTTNLSFSPVAGDLVVVTVEHTDFNLSMPFIGAFVGQITNISAEAQDLVLREYCP